MAYPAPMTDPDPDDLETVDDLLDEWEVSAGHARHTRETVVAFASWLAARDTGLFTATPDDCVEWLRLRRHGGAKPNTRIANWTHLRGLYKLAVADNLIAKSPMDAVDKPKPGRQPPRKAARVDEYQALIDQIDKRTALGLRDATLMSLMFRSGVRVGELAQINYDDLELEPRPRIFLAETKNDDTRWVPLHPETLKWLNRYLRRRGDRPGPLFLNDGPRALGPRMRTATVQSMFKRVAARADVNLSPHTLRRGFAVEYVRNGGAAVGAMAVAGWKKETMLNHYLGDLRDEAAHDDFDRMVAAQRQVRAGRLRAV